MGETMILRVFRAVIRAGRVEEFKRLVQDQSIPWLENSDGMLGYIAGRSLDESEREFTMVTLWRDLEAVRAFGGDQWNNPAVTEDEAPLVESMSVDHYTRFDRAP